MANTGINTTEILDKSTDFTSQNKEERGIFLPDPLALHHSDTPGLTLVSTLLNGRNMGNGVVQCATDSAQKNKLGLIDGSIEAPPINDAKFPLWQCCNDLVVSWILNSVQPEIARSVIYSDTAAMIWNDLKDRFFQGDESRIYQIRQEIVECRQGSLYISAYYTKLKGFGMN